MKCELAKPSALIAVAIVVGACTLAKRTGGESPEDTSNVGAGAPESAARAELDSKFKSHKFQDNQATTRSEIELQRPAGHPETAPPTAGPRRPDRPWAHNTGPSDPGALVASGSHNITTNGTVLENVNISGNVVINADNVTLRNFRLHDSAIYGIKIEPGHSGILIEDGEIYGFSAGILGAGWTGRRLYIHDVGSDAIKAQGPGGPTLVEYSFVEKIGMTVDSHADANQCTGGSNITFRYNNMWIPAEGPNYPGAPYNTNSAFMNSGTISNFVIEHNWLNGGNYTIYCMPGVSVRYNRFGRDYRFGPIAGTCTQELGNVWDDTGKPI